MKRTITFIALVAFSVSTTAQDRDSSLVHAIVHGDFSQWKPLDDSISSERVYNQFRNNLQLPEIDHSRGSRALDDDRRLFSINRWSYDFENVEILGIYKKQRLEEIQISGIDYTDPDGLRQTLGTPDTTITIVRPSIGGNYPMFASARVYKIYASLGIIIEGFVLGPMEWKDAPSFASMFEDSARTEPAKPFDFRKGYKNFDSPPQDFRTITKIKIFRPFSVAEASAKLETIYNRYLK